MERFEPFETFKLIHGCRVEDISECETCYERQDNNIFCSVTAQKLEPLAVGTVKLLKAPVFFFAELPCSDEEEKQLNSKDGTLHKNIYYLDNCTTEVALAIIKRYKHLLFADGLLQFGFGSHQDDSEIYFRHYQAVSFYGDAEGFEKILASLEIPKVKSCTAVSDVISEKNCGERFLVEAEGETVYDMIENLSEAGLYKHSTAEE